ncbi:S-DNA-T family DNA segregation ATPase FtsK/SpoIIIE [Nocardiopsis terrae]|uniref:S-DNA-T family DNA segregation ATPase FtsK/SpoIIIE n=1 Tax=Nocardiopsis terrae TaxID=372655 RepID=A0ABR9HAH1_9ACTN|nr:FtsK/SpoIIIE domain-containing protein [Nocardiopsis terrae]MBE1456025.1 S-DNA-T family DNA segregation ATPase FtsK/SpoIIIE [Nocardiopsis terrae]
MPVLTSVPRVDVIVDADPGATAQQLSEVVDPLVRLAPRFPDEQVPLFLGDQVVPAHTPLAEAGLHDGAVVGVGGPVDVRDEPPGVIEVRVVSGEAAGRVHRVDPGDYTVGDTDGSDLPLETGGNWVRIRVRPNGTVTLLGFGGPDEVTVEDETVRADDEWGPGDQLVLGDLILETWPNERPDASVLTSEDGTGLDYNRPPRLHPAPTKTKFRLPTPPEPPDKPLAQLAVMIMMPLLLAMGGALVMGRPQYMLIGLLAPISVLFMQLLQRRTSHARYTKQLTEFNEKTERVEGDARDALVTEQRRLRSNCPDPARVLLLATGPRSRLWERRPEDEDFTLLRVGTGTVPSQVVLTDPTKDEHRQDVTWDLYDVPVTVSIKEHGVVGVAGRGARTQALERWMVAQLAALHSPAELELYLLSLRKEHHRWEWTGRLPHLRSSTPNVSVSRIGVDATTCAQRIAELLAVLEARRKAARRAAEEESDIVVVLDGARRLRSLPGVVQLLREGPDFGIHVLCLDNEERLLPEECQAVVSFTDYELRLRRTKFDNVEEVRPDLPSEEWARQLGRALAPVRDSSVAEEGASLPRSARLLDVIGLEPPTSDAIAAHWTSNGRSTIATLGAGLDGSFSVDIRRDGPHALIAGTTGSGKSELLQTLVAALAVVNRPESMSFVLVDYKGGSAFKDCVDLPHTVGMVTDLDTHLVSRALVSLGAELHRRERILAEAGAKDIEDYVEMLDRNPDLPQMPRLMLVIDEFASLARELPDFVKGLVNIAQRGRSLGIHLVLATQRPGGVITPDIRANTNLRIALRVTDAAESRDVIDAVESAHIGIDTPGRAHARLGHASLLPFQTGRVGGRRVVAAADAPAPVVNVVRWEDLAKPAPSGGTADQSAGGDVEVTDLTVLVKAVQEAAGRLSSQHQPSPWKPALPTQLTLPQLNRRAPMAPAERGRLQAVPVGLIDLPAKQSQEPLTVDLRTLTHMHIIGTGRSGRSQALRTIAGALAVGHHPADVHMYGIDCGNGALLPLEAFPHCGAVVGRTQQERVVRLMGLLVAELERRQKLLAAQGCADLEELRSKQQGGERPAHIVVFCDRWEVFEQAFGEYNYGALVAEAVTLMRDGAGVGIHFVITGDRILTRSKYSSTTENRMVLRCNDQGDYSAAGLRARDLPEEIPNGRAFQSGDSTEAQFALLTEDVSGAAQAAELESLAAFTRRRFPEGAEPAPFRVDVLPELLTLQDTEPYLKGPLRPMWALLGVGGNELTAVGTDLAATPTFLVSGPPKSGRSSMLLTMAQSLIIGGSELLVVAPRASPLSSLRDHASVPAYLDSGEPKLSELHEALGKMEGETAVVVVDDAELLLSSDLGKEFTRIARGMVGPGWAIIAAGGNEALQGGFNGWHVTLKRNRMGALLSPQSQADGEVLGIRLPKGVPSPRLTPGTAYLHMADGRIQQIRVPLPG